MDVGRQAVFCGLREVEAGDRCFLHGRDAAGECGGHYMYPTESQFIGIDGVSRQNLFAGFDVAPAAEFPAVVFEEEVALGLPVSHGQCCVGIALNMVVNQLVKIYVR